MGWAVSAAAAQGILGLWQQGHSDARHQLKVSLPRLGATLGRCSGQVGRCACERVVHSVHAGTARSGAGVCHIRWQSRQIGRPVDLGCGFGLVHCAKW